MKAEKNGMKCKTNENKNDPNWRNGERKNAVCESVFGSSPMFWFQAMTRICHFKPLNIKKTSLLGINMAMCSDGDGASGGWRWHVCACVCDSILIAMATVTFIVFSLSLFSFPFLQRCHCRCRLRHHSIEWTRMMFANSKSSASETRLTFIASMAKPSGPNHDCISMRRNALCNSTRSEVDKLIR